MNEAPTREMCWTCRKPADHCLCAQIPLVHNQTGVVVLQHRKERNHPLGTARFIRLGLANHAVHVLLGQNGASAPVSLPPGAALLYPSDGAVELSTLAEGERPTDLVILDATWPLAHQLYRDNPWIRDLPHVRFTPDAPSRYRIRPEPRHECVSTLEAAVHALRIVEPELQGLDGLLSAFDHMIDRQISSGDGRGRPRPQRTRNRAPRAFPKVLDTPDERAVVAYIEQGPRVPGVEPYPIHWTAVRWRDGAVFDRTAVSEHPLPTGFIEGLGVDGATLRDGGTADAAWADFAQFCGPAPVLFCWNRTTQQFAEQGLPAATVARLKPVWTNHRRTRFVSHLDDIVAELGIDAPPLAARGRAGRRLALSNAMALHLRELRRAAMLTMDRSVP